MSQCRPPVAWQRSSSASASIRSVPWLVAFTPAVESRSCAAACPEEGAHALVRQGDTQPGLFAHGETAVLDALLGRIREELHVARPLRKIWIDLQRHEVRD